MGLTHPPFLVVMSDMKRLSILLVALVAGMSVFAKDPPLFQTLPYEASLVTIDGKPFTKRDALRDAKTFVSLIKNKQRRAGISGADLNFVRRYCQGAVRQHVLEALTEKYAQKHGLSPSQELLDAVTYRFTRQYGVRSKKLHRWHTLDDLKWMLGPKGPRLDQEIRSRALYQLVTNHIVTVANIVVTPQMVTNRLEYVAKLNRDAQATNDLVFARATNVWKKIVAKTMTFEQAATNYTEDVEFAEDGCEWGTFSLDQIQDDPEVLALLPKLKVGDVTPPVESDNGLAILRLDPSDDPKHYTFSRIFFRLPMFFEVETPKTAEASVRGFEAEKRIAEAFDALKGELKIEYPNGTNLFDKDAKRMRLTNEDLRE